MNPSHPQSFHLFYIPSPSSRHLSIPPPRCFFDLLSLYIYLHSHLTYTCLRIIHVSRETIDSLYLVINCSSSGIPKYTLMRNMSPHNRLGSPHPEQDAETFTSCSFILIGNLGFQKKHSSLISPIKSPHLTNVQVCSPTVELFKFSHLCYIHLCRRPQHLAVEAHYENVVQHSWQEYFII